jgi:hypothetical protein
MPMYEGKVQGLVKYAQERMYKGKAAGTSQVMLP